MKRQLELFSKVGSVKKKAVKAKVGDPVYNAYKKAPLAVKKIIDTLDSHDSYTNLNNAAKKLKKLGWKMDFSLDGLITKLTKMKKTTKKVGAKPKVKKAPARSTHKDTKSHNVNIRVMSGIDSIDFTRVNNDIYGNPRYVIHFMDILNPEERMFLPFSKMYDYAIKKGKKLGGKKFHNKQYGGGIVFQSYNISDLEKKLIDLKHTTPKIKY
jgi:hypothetical protein